MKRILIGAVILMSGCIGPCYERASQEYATPTCEQKRADWKAQLRSAQNSQSHGSVTPNAYGPGIGMDATGRPVTLRPSHSDPSGDYSNSYIQRKNAYGPGIHMDQYGRAVSY